MRPAPAVNCTGATTTARVVRASEREPVVPQDRDNAAGPAMANEPMDRSVVIPRIDAGALFDGRTELILEHNGEAYRLRVTSKGRLVLTK